MNKPLSHLLQACSLIVLCGASLCASAQTPAPNAQPAQSTPPPAHAAPPGGPTPVTPAAPAAPPPPPPLTSEEASYLIGVNFGQSIHQFGITNEVSVDTIIRGLHDGMDGKKLEPTDQRGLQMYIRTVMDGITQRNLKTGKDFLEKNGHEKGVVTTTSGLEYKILSAGDKKAPFPAPTDQVAVHYRGTLIDGSEFDKSPADKPTTFPVNAIIKGWQEALVLMKPGAKWRLWIPADLAYGNSPKPGIPAGSTLIFDVELVSASAAPPAPPRPAGPARMMPGMGAPPAPVPPPAPPASSAAPKPQSP